MSDGLSVLILITFCSVTFFILGFCLGGLYSDCTTRATITIWCRNAVERDLMTSKRDPVSGIIIYEWKVK